MPDAGPAPAAGAAEPGTAASGPDRPWHALDAADAAAALGTGPNGLAEAEAAARLDEHGPNELPTTPPEPWWRTAARQFISPIIAMLAVALVITVVLDELVDAGAIAAILLLNAALGYWQERKSAREVRALASLSAPECRVERDGAVRVLPAAELVPGDVVLLASGDRVPADLRLVETANLQVDESMLTGESVAATKTGAAVDADAPIGDREGMAYSGTLVRTGRARAIVVGTGLATELGEISDLVQGPAGRTPLEELTAGLEHRILLIIGVASTVLFATGWLLGGAPGELFRSIVALAVAAIPESLPIVLTVAMSVGVTRMARRNALVRSLPAVETLGSTTVIGSDKTGTLTMNELVVEAVWTAGGELDLADADAVETRALPVPGAVARAALRAGALSNEARRVPGERSALIGDPVDVAMAKAALRTGALDDEEFAARPLAHAPYESELRYSQTVRELDGERWLFVKGAPDALLAVADRIAVAEGRGPDARVVEAPIDRERVEAANAALAARGMRVLATARRRLAPDEAIADPLPPPGGLTLLGLEGMTDPPRPGVPEAIAACHDAGIEVIMITGDHPATAVAIAERLGLPVQGEPLVGAEIGELSDGELVDRLRSTAVAARVSPRDKRRIVDVLQDRGEIVAVTGDGVNDAPALKAASLGVAMGRSGTDVAREAADVVLTDDDFVTVVDAVEQGRVTFNAIRKATHFLLANGLASLIAVPISVYADMPLIFLPVQMLFMNVVTNGVQDIALAFERAEGDELRRRPRPRTEGVLSAVLWWRTALAGAWMAIATLGMFLWALDAGLAEDHARTLTMTLFIMMNFWFVHASRYEYRSIVLRPWGNPHLVVGSLAAVGLFWGAMNWPVSAGLMGFVPLSWQEWLLCIGLGVSSLLVVEADKIVQEWRRRRARNAGVDID
ncbi:MAG: HAD-IC family P-type ATPase [Microbacteriaceae bacterium]|nr:HAD-IC family P-type ATPase [Microbacteriaceae bacterium]